MANEKPEHIRKWVDDVLNDKIFGFEQVDIKVPEKLWDKFSEMSPFFVVQEIPDSCVPANMKKYQIDTGRTTAEGTKKLLGLMKAEKILIYTPNLKWFLRHGLEITAVYEFI